ncbi:type I-E CRISPR-associated protein Cas5/CasD [Streptomyces griseoaurantiacus]|uniref:type I-E CRISPR-associated protein Cas5/CasD n=1 Tax=Streptomyces griseoaurantiacus TaxID=68213 RepID=UPI003789D28D
MSGLVLRLAGPLQSWGERSAFTPVRDTAPFPTRSALIGLFAAAEGIGRGDGGIDRYDSLQITVRVDRPGTRIVDYHTVGGGMPKARTAATSGGSNKGAAVITRRHYLSDAVFVVAVSGPAQTLARLADALRNPHWAPYLGRRSCVPDEPFLLRADVEDPERELLTRVPLSHSTPAGTADMPIAVEFLRERPPTEQSASSADTLDVNDIPVSFSPRGRSHRMRRLYRTVEQLPQALTGPQHSLLRRLIDYAQTEESV